MPAVELERVSGTFGPNLALDDLCLAVSRQGIHGFIGLSGTGCLEKITRKKANSYQ